MRRRRPPDPQRLANRAEVLLRAQAPRQDGQSVRCPGCDNHVPLADVRLHALTCAALLSDVEWSENGVLSFRTLAGSDAPPTGDAESERQRLDAAETAALGLEVRVETLQRELSALTYERKATQATLQSAGREIKCLRRLARELQLEIDRNCRGEVRDPDSDAGSGHEAPPDK